MKRSRGTLVPTINAISGARGFIDTGTLPKQDWKVHSGPAPVAGEEVHSLQSQKIAGTKNLVIRAESGKEMSVTDGEAERFAFEHLKGLGYTVNPPA